MLLEITDSNFEELLESGKPMVVDFWAQWCGPCKMMLPIVGELADEYDGKIIVGKCDVDECDDVPAEFGIMNIPTMLFFKDGKLVNKHVGACAKDELQKLFDALL
ncbi:MAG: thioredoxin [Paludibacteraceae bacterium]|nr:thioredoxin [Paludibacteraceae bacterium]